MWEADRCGQSAEGLIAVVDNVESQKWNKRLTFQLPNMQQTDTGRDQVSSISRKYPHASIIELLDSWKIYGRE